MRSFVASIRPDATRLLSRTLSKVLVTASFLVLSCTLVAQTAHFSGSVFTRGSGFGNPDGVAVDRSGNLFVADQGNGAVYELPAAGGYTTLITLSTQFTIPSGMAVDGNENVFVTDQGTGRVYEMLAAGNYTTANQLGSGFSNPNGVAVDASGNVFVADTLNNLVKEILAVNGSIPSSNPTINTLGQANGNFNHPTSVAVDASGNVFVADSQNSQVKEIVAAGGYVTVNTLGTGFSGDNGVALDGSGNLFVVDSNHHVIKELLAAGSYTTESTLDGVFNYPANAAVDGRGNVFVSDFLAGAVYEIMLGGVDFGFLSVGTSTPGTRTLTFTFATAGTGTTEAVSTQGAAGLDFADAGTGSCHMNGAGHAYAIGDTCTVDVTFTPTAAGTRYGAVQLMNTSASVIATGYIYGTGLGPQVNFLPGTQSPVGSGLLDPEGVAVDDSGNVYIADTNNNRVLKETLSAGAYTQTAIVTGLNTPKGIALDGAGNLYIADTGNDQVLVESLSGGSYIQSTVGSGLSSPDGVAVDGSGNVFIADSANNRVMEETLSGGAYNQVTVTTSALNGPWRVAVDGSDNLYIADTGNARVLKETLSGSGYIESVIGSGLGSPKGLALDGMGNVYIADSGTNLVLEEAVSGAGYTQSTIASGLNQPKGVTVDRNGNVFIDDTLSSEVLKVDFADPPSLSFATTNEGSTSGDSPQTVTLSNIGNAALTFPVPGSGSNPSITTSFTLGSTTTCPEVSSTAMAGSVAAGSSCTYAVDFTPVATGALSGALVLTDTNLNAVAATQTILLSGSGSAVASKLAFTGVATTLAAGGNLGTISVSVETSSGSVFPTSSASITVTITGPGGYSQSATGAAASGVASLNLSSLAITTAGTYTVTASSPGLTPAISTVTVTAGAASQLVTSAVPATVASGGNLGTLGVAIEDRFGNVVTTSSAMVTVTITGPGGYSHGVTGNAVNGVASILLTSLVFTTAGTYTVTTTSGSLSSVHTFVIAANATPTATVTALTSSNLAPTYGQSITLTATITPAPTAAPPGSIKFYAGTTLLGTQALNAHGIGALSLSLPLGPNTITAVYSGSAGFAASTSSPLSVSARALSAITFSANPTTQLATMPVVFTALVNSATAGLQTGTVSFLNGTTVLATVTIVPGQPATYSETGLSSGAYSVTATYSGDGNFLPGASTGAPVSITVSDLDLALGGDNNKSVVPGGAVTYNFPLSPVVTSTFIYSVALTATGLPPGATYTFSPSTIPAGSGTLPVAFTVQTAKTTAMLHRAPGSSRSPWLALIFGLLLPLAGAKRFRARLTTRPRMLLLFGGLSLGLVAGLGGCGSGGFLGSPTGQTSYTITISATSGTLVRTSTVQLNLE